MNTEAAQFLKPGVRLFFCGIGGSGMNPLAHVMARRGCVVSGSDAREQETLAALRAAGAVCFAGHAASHVGDVDAFVYSSAIAESNPEFAEARRRGIPCIHRAELLAALVNGMRGVTVAGAHGKTTATAMAALMFTEAGLDPTAVVGGFVPAFDAYHRAGGSDWAVVETDESDGSFELFAPETAVALNIDADHLDHYAGIDEIEQAFTRHLAAVKPGGCVVYNADDERLRRVVETLRHDVRPLACSLVGNADYRAEGIALEPWGSSFSVRAPGGSFPVRLGVPGMHNVANALHAIAAARQAGCAVEPLQRACAAFHGVHRRFQVLGSFNDATIIDDYAHHPREIKAVLAMAANLGRPVLAVFQPHRFSRLAALLDEFTDVLRQAERLILCEVYSAGETPGAVTGETLYNRLSAVHGAVRFIPDLDDLAREVRKAARPGDVLLFLGAGSISAVAHRLARDGASHQPAA
ncbi:UDP-N-acetylmuramate--L-alanine ligase [bacterium]|nr:UDP-N-acetylmuramate--L-alanine ligase [bacterium]